MKDYPAITQMLQENSDLSLNLYFHDMNYGVQNIRLASIMESNPDTGKIGGSGDQEYIIGPRHPKKGFRFAGREINEAIGLLERACVGENGLRNTVSDYARSSKETIHGYTEAKGGLDNWIVAGFLVEVQKKKDNLIAKVESYDFHAKQNIVVSKKEVKTVREAIGDYQKHDQNITLLKHIQRGVLLQESMTKYNALESNYTLNENIGKFLNGENDLLNEYRQGIESLKPLGISQEAKEALFVSMLIKELHGTLC